MGIALALLFLFFCIIFFLEKRFYRLNKATLYRVSTGIVSTLILWFIYSTIQISIGISEVNDYLSISFVPFFLASFVVLYVTIEKVGEIEHDVDATKLLAISFFLSTTFLLICHYSLKTFITIDTPLLSLAFGHILMLTIIFLVLRVIQQIKIDLTFNKREITLKFYFFIAIICGVAIIGWFYTFLYMFVKFEGGLSIVAEFVAIFLLIATTTIYGENQYKYKEEQLKKNNKRLSFLAYHDQLTHLSNRTKISEVISELVTSKAHFAIIYIDIDGFKFVNDLLDHRKGDQLLVHISERLTALKRKGDIVGRLSGDEFVYIYTSYEKHDQLKDFVTAIKDAISEPVVIDGYPITVTSSIGIAEHPHNGDNINDLLKNSDIALYHAKNKGGNVEHFFSNKHDMDVVERIQLKEDMKTALGENQFKIVYQPQVDVQSGNIIGFEALIRWIHPTKGVIPPLTFIPIAEETGLISEIGEWVLKESCKQIVSWNKKYKKAYKMSVNLSLKQLLKDDFVLIVKDTLQQTKLPPSLLELEITESVAMADVERTKNTFKQLHDLGVQLSLDDFGTGYSSLSYIQQFNINRIKIDKSFIQDLLFDEKDYYVVTGILAMAGHLNLQVTAEGVETEDHLQFIKKYNCQEAQGYYFSKPLSPEHIEKKLEKVSSI
jgi:diguanylate cyclase